MEESPTETTSYEAARDELVSVVQQLETGGATLAESVTLWERGEELAAICRRWLDGVQERLDAAIDRERPATGSASRERPATGSASPDATGKSAGPSNERG